jgi:pyruvate/2-oxoglutarate dehydrogenase complex dihydrolipoamide acyltransferase (E2) component
MTFIASPSVRAYAATKGVDLPTLASATGRQKLARDDVDFHLENKEKQGAKSAHAADDHMRFWDVDHSGYGPVTIEPMSRIAQVAAANLGAANALIPQVTHHDRADMQAVENMRKDLRDEASGRGIKLTALAFHVKVLSRCLRDFPRFNSSLGSDGKKLILKSFFHIGIAIDTPYGLMVPVIRNADRKGLWQIAQEIADFAKRGQSRKIRPEEMGGASMSISNLGGIGGMAFTPIVNPPEVAILGLTRTELVPVWDGTSWLPVPMVPLDLSYDHRVVNGADAARFLSRYAKLLGDLRHLLDP